MKPLSQLFSIEDYRKHLEGSRTIAVVGLSPKDNRPSNMVARYLIDAGYNVIPVNPGQSEILSRACYPDLASIPEPVDIIDVFRRSEDILPIVQQALEMKPLPALIWLQQGIVNTEAAELARARGLGVVMDRCLKVEHAALGL